MTTKGPDYTSTSGGQLATRTWARGTTTTYSHNNAGEVSGIDYSDSTPDVTYTYDRLGRQKTCSSSADSISYAYNLAGQMTNENHTAGILANISVISGYDSVLRRNSLSAKLSGSPLTSTSYSYDNASRLASVSDGTNSASYTYVVNASLVSNIVFQYNGTAKMTTTKSYDNLNRLTSISSVGVSNQVISSHSYQYNMANQRTKATLNDSSSWNYGYDSVLRRNSLSTQLSGSPLSGASYTYDNASRLASVSDGTDSAEYTYLANSSLITNIVFKHSGNTKMTTTKSYDNLNRLTAISSQLSGGSVVSSHSYTYNSANQRTKATLNDNAYWDYGYDSLGQVTNGVKKWADNTVVLDLCPTVSW